MRTEVVESQRSQVEGQDLGQSPRPAPDNAQFDDRWSLESEAWSQAEADDRTLRDQEPALTVAVPIPVPLSVPLPTPEPVGALTSTPISGRDQVVGSRETAAAEVVVKGEGGALIRLVVKTTGTRVDVWATAESPSDANALKAHVADLRTALSRHGLELKRLASRAEGEAPEMETETEEARGEPPEEEPQKRLGRRRVSVRV